MSNTQTNRLSQWIIEHDERWAFTLGYVGLAVGLSLWLGLFWLIVMVGVHFAFEWVRQSRRFATRRGILLEALWETKLDMALVIFALALSVYMEAVFGLLGLRSAGQMAATLRVGARAAPRVGGWQTAIRGILLTLDDAAQIARGLFRSRQPGNDPPGTAAGKGSDRKGDRKRAGSPSGAGPAPARSSWLAQWSVGDWLAIGLTLLSIGLILTAPWFTERDMAGVFTVLLGELRPFPG